MVKDDSIDYYQIDSLLTGEEKGFRERVRRFVDEECMPIIVKHFDQGTFPLHLIPRMARDTLGGAVFRPTIM